jgi:alpha-galactosidase
MANAAVIAVNQDPLGSSAARRWYRESTNVTDSYGRPATTQMWAGNLNSTTGGAQNDVVVVLVNGHSDPLVMEATLADIFVDSGTAGTAPQVQLAWEVRDLWGYRMTDEEAATIIARAEGEVEGNATIAAPYNGTSYYYNATAMSYAQGLANK